MGNKSSSPGKRCYVCFLLDRDNLSLPGEKMLIGKYWRDDDDPSCRENIPRRQLRIFYFCPEGQGLSDSECFQKAREMEDLGYIRCDDNLQLWYDLVLYKVGLDTSFYEKVRDETFDLPTFDMLTALKAKRHEMEITNEWDQDNAQAESLERSIKYCEVSRQTRHPSVDAKELDIAALKTRIKRIILEALEVREGLKQKLEYLEDKTGFVRRRLIRTPVDRLQLEHELGQAVEPLPEAATGSRQLVCVETESTQFVSPNVLSALLLSILAIVVYLLVRRFGCQRGCSPRLRTNKSRRASDSENDLEAQ